MELIARNEPPNHLGIDICLRRLAYADWREKWPADEAEAIDRFFAAVVVASLPRLELALWPVGWRLDFDLADLLTLVATADGDISRVLSAWNAAAEAPLIAALDRDGPTVWPAISRSSSRTGPDSATSSSRPRGSARVTATACSSTT